MDKIHTEIYFFAVLGDRPSSQMSFLDQFLKESSVSRNTTPGRDTGPGPAPPPGPVQAQSRGGREERSMTVDTDT